MKSKRQQLVELLKPIVKEILKENSNFDWAVNEAILYAENDQKLYNLLMKKYLPILTKAKPVDQLGLMGRYVVEIIKQYNGERNMPKQLTLNPAQRQEVAQNFLDNLKNEKHLK